MTRKAPARSLTGPQSRDPSPIERRREEALARKAMSDDGIVSALRTALPHDRALLVHEVRSRAWALRLQMRRREREIEAAIVRAHHLRVINANLLLRERSLELLLRFWAPELAMGPAPSSED